MYFENTVKVAIAKGNRHAPLFREMLRYRATNNRFQMYWPTIYRIREQLSLEGTSGDHLVQLLWVKQGHPQTAAQNHIQTVFEYRQGWRPHSIPGQPVPALCHPHSKRKCFLMFGGTVPVWKWVSKALLMSTQTIFAAVLYVPGNGFKDELFHHLPRIEVRLTSLFFPALSLPNFLLKYWVMLNFSQ